MTFLRIVIPSVFLFEHDLFRKPVSTFRDHALAHALGVAREPRRKIDDEVFERTGLLVVAEVGHGHHQGARARIAVRSAQTSGVRASIGFKESRALGAGQMADFEDDRDVLCRDRHQIGRIGDLGDEGAVLAQRRGELQPRSGRPVVEHPPQDELVFRDIAVAMSVCALACIVHHEPTLAMAALSRATAIGDTDSVVRPVASSAVVRRVSAPASPQSETWAPRLRPASTVLAISASTAGLPVSLRSATAPMSRAAAMVYWVRSFEPME